MPVSSVRFLLGFVGALVLLVVAWTVWEQRAGKMHPVPIRLNGPYVEAPASPPPPSDPSLPH